MSIAYDTAVAIENDIRGRKGLGNEWEEIDPDIQKEILGVWTVIIQDALERGG